MMSKRVFSNISNIRALNGDKEVVAASKRSVKRTLLLSPNKPHKLVTKKSKSDLTSGQNNENHEVRDLTLSIERKVRAIAIACETTADSVGSGRSRSPNGRSHTETRSLAVPLLTLSPATSDSSMSGDESFEAIDFADPTTYYCPPSDLPESVEDFDKSQLNSIESEPHYASDIFKYYRERELEVPTKKYLQRQPELNKAMRAVLVDWMVEVQESFELNHETLYLAVKVIDQYLMREQITKAEFQLVGATALLIAAKFDERIPPAIEDFLYICDDAYARRDVIIMEMKILKSLEFDLCFPISYRFLRRYARCAKLSMETLTLARFVLEMSLMEYDIIEETDSRVAAAALLLALRMKGQSQWNPTLEYYSSYKEDELTILMYRLNDVISSHNKTKTIRTKYSHKIFFEVAKTPSLPRIKAERM